MTNFSAMNPESKRSAIPVSAIADQYGIAMAIVIQACRVYFGTASIHELNQLLNTAPEAHSRVALLSRLHRIRPIVYRVLLEANISAQIKEQLKNELHAITLHNFAIAQETQRILNRLKAHDIAVIPYKGVAFSNEFYGDVSMRESSDIDLIINPNDIDKIVPILIEDGYKCHYAKSLARIDRNKLLEQQKDICFDKKSEPRFHVEFHWRIIHPNFLMPKPTSEFIIQRKERFELEKIEHFRAVLLHHWAHDGLEYLKTLVDLAQAYQNPNKTEIHHYLTKENTNNGLNIVLEVVNQIFGIETIAKNKLNKTEKRLINQIVKFNLESKVGRIKGTDTILLVKQYYRYYTNQLHFISGIFKKLKFTIRFWIGLLSPKQGDIEVIGLPKYLQLFYVLVRPFRLLIRNRS